MQDRESFSSARMVFGEDGVLLFANPEAMNLAGFSHGLAMPLDRWLEVFFPEEPEHGHIAGLIGKVVDACEGSGNDSFQTLFLDWQGRPHVGIFNVHAWHEAQGGVRLLIHLSTAWVATAPAEHAWEGLSPGTLSSIARQVLHLVDEAISECMKLQGEDHHIHLLPVTSVLSRARSLLAGVRGLARAWNQMDRPKKRTVVSFGQKVLDTVSSE